MSNTSKQEKVRRALLHPQGLTLETQGECCWTDILTERPPYPQAAPWALPRHVVLPHSLPSSALVVERTALRNAVQLQESTWRVTSCSWEASQQHRGGAGNSVVRGFPAFDFYNYLKISQLSNIEAMWEKTCASRAALGMGQRGVACLLGAVSRTCAELPAETDSGNTRNVVIGTTGNTHTPVCWKGQGLVSLIIQSEDTNTKLTRGLAGEFLLRSRRDGAP